MRKYAIGDIHGCLDKLDDLLVKISPEPDDTLIFLGDYVDRGDDSRGVIERLVGLSDQCRCIFLRGNHEDMLIEFIEFGANEGLWLRNGGMQTMMSYAGEKSITSKALSRLLPDTHREFLASLRWYHEDERYIYAHAGIRGGLDMNRQDPMDLLWIRSEFLNQPTGLDRKVIFGHTPFPEPYVKEDRIGIDTGAVYGRHLTAIELPSERFIRSFGKRKA